MARTPDFDSKRILVVLLGGASDRSWHRQSALRARVDLINLVGRTSLREAIAVIQRARLAVGPGTGLMHIAAAVRAGHIALECHPPATNRALRFFRPCHSRNGALRFLLSPELFDRVGWFALD